jgi:hypothetical protein
MRGPVSFPAFPREMALLYSAIICMHTEGRDGMGGLVIAEKTALGLWLHPPLLIRRCVRRKT